MLVDEHSSIEIMAKTIKESKYGDFPVDWVDWSNTKDSFTSLINEQLKKEVEIKEYSGQGIVIGAGGKKCFLFGYICAYVLRYLNCKLPIQFWYLGPQELDDTMEKIVKELDIECIDAMKIEKSHPMRVLNGWELKPFSILHSKFEEVLYLDSDNVPVNNPNYLFEDDRYKKAGAIFWPDIPLGRAAVPKEVFDIFQIPFTDLPPMESGQLLINKLNCKEELELTVWINNYSDFFYKKIYGDKDTFLLSWWKLAISKRRPVKYTMPNKMVEWLSGENGAGAFLQYDLNDQLIFQHRCQPNPNKWLLNEKNNRIPKFIHEEVCLEAIENLRKKWNGTIDWINKNQTQQETEITNKLISKKFIEICHINTVKSVQKIELGIKGKIIKIGKEDDYYQRKWRIECDEENRIRMLIYQLDGIKPIYTIKFEEESDIWKGSFCGLIHSTVELKPLIIN